MKKTFLIIFFVLGLTASLASQANNHVSAEEYQAVKDSLVRMTLRWEESITMINNLQTAVNNLATDLNEVKDIDQLKEVLKKYKLEKK